MGYWWVCPAAWGRGWGVRNKLGERSICSDCRWKLQPGMEDRAKRSPAADVNTHSQRNHIIISEGDSSQTFHLKTVILQMFNYFSNAKNDCKFVICPVRSYQPQPPWVTGKKNILHRKLKWFDQFIFKMIFHRPYVFVLWSHLYLRGDFPVKDPWHSKRQLLSSSYSHARSSRFTLVPAALLRNHLKIKFWL